MKPEDVKIIHVGEYQPEGDEYDPLPDIDAWDEEDPDLLEGVERLDSVDFVLPAEAMGASGTEMTVFHVYNPEGYAGGSGWWTWAIIYGIPQMGIGLAYRAKGKFDPKSVRDQYVEMANREDLN